ncbi:MAG: hypothetical protein CML46_03540 [Rhodobacteraceae bacterium]|nr:hypothetical protein [Paracoccaceae bacterium]MBR26015.1 hypothetical protein [Paracoccaceae bacterium]
MAVILRRHRLLYLPVPKVANTSLKHFFFEIENGRRFENFIVNGVRKHIHTACYPSRRFRRLALDEVSDLHRIAVVRDPLDRFVSAYNNRVLHHRDMTAKPGKLKAAGLDPMPGINEFAARLEDYRAAHVSIRHHTLPMTAFLGEDAGFFHKLYDMRDCDRLAEDVLERVGGPRIELRRMQTGKSPDPARREDLEPANIARIKAFYAKDYATWGRVFAA